MKLIKIGNNIFNLEKLENSHFQEKDGQQKLELFFEENYQVFRGNQAACVWSFLQSQQWIERTPPEDQKTQNEAD